MPGTMLSRGNLVMSYLIGPSLTPTAVAVSTSTEQLFTISGLLPGDEVGAVGFSSTQTAGIGIANTRVSAANTLAIQFSNNSAATATPAAGQYVIEINRPEVGAAALPTNLA